MPVIRVTLSAMSDTDLRIAASVLAPIFTIFGLLVYLHVTGGL